MIPHILSLGAGVQSSTLALMAANGEVPGLPTPIGAIFSDTQDEPASVYRWLDWLEAEILKSPHPFPVHRVTAGSLSKKTLTMRTTKDGRKFSSADIPFFTLSQDGKQGKIPNRGCTRDFKIKPIMRAARRIAGIKRGQKTVGVVQWIGISLDEIYRMKPSREPWAESIWPLVDMGMKRHDCLLWMERRGYPKPPRSSCVYCPYHNNAEWRRLRDEEPAEFQRAVDFERKLQDTKARTDNFGSTPFLHRSLVPLDQVDFSTAEERGQLDLFTSECEGICGV